jgi:hypothetical protein
VTKRAWLGVLLVASVISAALAGEIALRLIGWTEPPPPVPVARFPDLYTAHPELGYTLKPSAELRYVYPLRSTNVVLAVTNRDGFRNAREFDGPDPRPRIWVLGDSMVLGEGVAADDRLTEVVESLEPGWRVDNMGMSGWGLDLMVRAFERISQRVRPKVIVLGFYTDDFRRLLPYYSGQGFAIPKFQLTGDGLVSVPYPPLPYWRRLRTVQAIEQSYWRFRRNRFDLNEALLERLRHDCEPNTLLTVAFLPGRGDTEEDRLRRSWLRAWCERTHTPFLDLTDVIQHVGLELTYITDNPHWNARGHRVAGEAIHRFLRETVLSGGGH